MTRAFALGCALLIALVGSSVAAPRAKKAEPAPACDTLVAPLLAQLKGSGLEHEIITDGLTVLKIAAAIKEQADAPFQMPTSIAVVYLGEQARIGIISGDRLCNVIRAPAGEVRKMLTKVRGHGA